MGLLEQPLVILFSGAFVFAVASAVWLQTRRPGALVAILATVAATAAGLLVERLVVTEAEQVEILLHQIARDVEQNDIQSVCAQISQASAALRAEAQDVLSRVTIERVSIKRNLRVEVVQRAGRMSAVARFNAVATVKDRRGVLGPQIVPRFLVVRLRRETDGWKVIDYEAFDPRDGTGGWRLEARG